MFKQWRIAFILVVLAMFSIFISACGSGDNSGTGGNSNTPTTASIPKCDSGNITFDGSTALFPLANDAQNKYTDACNGATITPKQSGSGTGLQEVHDGSIQIGNSDIFADATKYPGLVDHQVAVVVFSVIVSSDVTGVTNLSSQQISDIYTGKITDWSQVGGPSKKITTISRKTGSGTRVTFDKYILNGAAEKGGSSNLIADTSGDVATTLKATPGSIAYISTSYAKKNNLTTLKIDGVDDSDANVESNTYKFWNIEHMYTKGEATGLTKDFIDYMKSDVADMKQLRTKDGFIALSAMSQSALNAKQPSA